MCFACYLKRTVFIIYIYKRKINGKLKCGCFLLDFRKKRGRIAVNILILGT